MLTQLLGSYSKIIVLIFKLFNFQSRITLVLLPNVCSIRHITLVFVYLSCCYVKNVLSTNGNNLYFTITVLIFVSCFTTQKLFSFPVLQKCLISPFIKKKKKFLLKKPTSRLILLSLSLMWTFIKYL